MMRNHSPSYTCLRLTVGQFSREKPLLLRAIMAVTLPTTHEKQIRKREVKAVVNQIVMEEVKSCLDLLLCIITYAMLEFHHISIKETHYIPSISAASTAVIAYLLEDHRTLSYSKVFVRLLIKWRIPGYEPYLDCANIYAFSDKSPFLALDNYYSESVMVLTGV
ncbi:hypothetical protein BJX63DRAFT_376261 [Aspergillus granulosus]|uniref:Uncharacterized protein n=1 Tax=Aspergillus granulosus TaxID=176169 RepID=A0ABR4I737_9EURO